ncbi:MAG: hypothetical protein ACRYGK_17260 [Janthinobacterium lividum]
MVLSTLDQARVQIDLRANRSGAPEMVQVIRYGEVEHFFAVRLIRDKEMEEEAMCMVRWFVEEVAIDRFGTPFVNSIKLGSLEARKVDELECMIGLYEEDGKYFIIDRGSIVQADTTGIRR